MAAKGTISQERFNTRWSIWQADEGNQDADDERADDQGSV
jgi:hypothetical protein